MLNVWTRQPQTAVRVKRNGIGKDIAFVFSGAVQNKDLVKGLRGSAASSDSYVPSKPGMAFRGARVTSGGVNFGNVQPITGDVFTVVAVANPAYAAACYTLFSQRNGSAPINQIDLAINANQTLGGSAGKIAAITFDTTGSFNHLISTGTGYSDGGWHAYAMTRAGVGSTPLLYFDGVSVSGTPYTGSSGTSISAAMHTRVGNIGDYTVDGAYAAQCDIAFVAVWNRVLSAREISGVYANPWIVFEPFTERKTFGPAASSSSSFTSASGASTTSTLTGASTAQATASSAAGASTASTLTGASTASATATAAAGSSTASTLTGASTASATASSAAGVSTASTMAGGSTSALSSFTQADGASTASTMAGGSISEASIIYASGSSSTATMVGAGSVDTMARPGADVLTTGWHASTGTDLFDMIDEASADDADYIYRDLAGSDPYVFELWLSGVAYSLPAGSHVVRMRADVTAGAAQARLLLLDASDNVVGTGAWQSLTPGLATTTFTVDSAASATKGRIEAVAA